MYCNTNQFPSVPFFGPHPNPHGARGLSKHYHLRFDPKLVHDICAIRHVTCESVACTPMLDKPCISGITSKKQPPYQPVVNCTYWPIIGSFKNWNITQLSHKATPFEAFKMIH